MALLGRLMVKIAPNKAELVSLIRGGNVNCKNSTEQGGPCVVDT
jgi:hypothetical protein